LNLLSSLKYLGTKYRTLHPKGIKPPKLLNDKIGVTKNRGITFSTCGHALKTRLKCWYLPVLPIYLGNYTKRTPLLSANLLMPPSLTQAW
jgi:hypothetical protein